MTIGPGSLCIHGDRRVQQKAALPAVVTQGRAVLDRHSMPAARPLGGARRGGGDHLLVGDARIAQPARQPDLTRAITAKLANRCPALPDFNEPL